MDVAFLVSVTTALVVRVKVQVSSMETRPVRLSPLPTLQYQSLSLERVTGI